MALVPVPKEPGRFYDSASGKYVDIVDYYDSDRYDTVSRASGAITAGTEDQLFKNLGSKEKIDANIAQAARLSQGEQMLIRRVGVDIMQCFGDTVVVPANIKKIAYGGYLLLKLNNRTVAEGPLYTFPCGYGIAGQTTENNTGVVTNGVPSTAAQRQLEKSHWLTSAMDIEGSIKYFDRTWDVANMATTTSRVHVRVFLGGLVRLKS